MEQKGRKFVYVLITLMSRLRILMTTSFITLYVCLIYQLPYHISNVMICCYIRMQYLMSSVPMYKGCPLLWRWKTCWNEGHRKESNGQDQWNLSLRDGWQGLCLWWREDLVYCWISPKKQAGIHCCARQGLIWKVTNDLSSKILIKLLVTVQCS